MESVTSAETATGNTIDRAHHMYKEGKYREALRCYTDALSMAKTKQQKIALHSNRAACYLKLYDFNEAAEECTSVLELDHNHTGALMLRAQTLVTLKDYHSAIFDVNRLIELNPSSEVYRNLQARLKTQLSLAPIPEDEAEFEEDEEENENDYDGNENMEEEEEEEYDEIEICENQEIDASNDAAIMLNSKSDFQKVDQRVEAVPSENEIRQPTPPHQQSSSLQAIPKPKGHTHLDYSKWDRFVDDSSDGEDRDSDDDEDEDSQPRYKFRVKTVGVKAVK